MSKILYIMRGVTGSGKSTKGNELVGETGAIFSTDDYFVNKATGAYEFAFVKLTEAHLWNQNRAMMAMIQGVSPVVVDNTNTQAWEAKPYVQAGVLLGYEVVIVEPSTPWAFDALQLSQKTRHGVPLDGICKMLSRWEKNITVDDILASHAPWEKPAGGG